MMLTVKESPLGFGGLGKVWVFIGGAEVKSPVDIRFLNPSGGGGGAWFMRRTNLPVEHNEKYMDSLVITRNNKEPNLKIYERQKQQT